MSLLERGRFRPSLFLGWDGFGPDIYKKRNEKRKKNVNYVFHSDTKRR